MFFLFFLFSLSTALRLKAQANEKVSSSGGGYQLVEDHGDTFMSIGIEVGGQQLTVIPDSGSFDLYLLAGAKCDAKICEKAYDETLSESFTAPKEDLYKDIVFGSGAAKAKLAFDTVKVRDDSSSGMPANEDVLASTKTFSPDFDNSRLSPVWEIVGMSDSLKAVWGDGKGFQGIVGIGYKGNTGKESDEAAAEEAAAIEASLTSSSSSSLPGKGSEALFGHVFAICMPKGPEAQTAMLLEKAQAAHQKALAEISGLQHEIQVDLSSSLLQKHPTHTGRLWWGSKIPHLDFQEVPVTGSRHWAVELAHVAIVPPAADAPQSKDNQVNMCQGHPCAALLDSGTSLLALPETRITQIMQDSDIAGLNPDCSNVDDMPDLHLTLGKFKKISLVLTPETYIMKVEADLDDLKSLVDSVKPEKGKGYPKLLLRLDAAIEKLNKKNEELKGKYEEQKLYGNSSASSYILEQKLKKKQIFCTPAFMVSPINHASMGSEGEDHEVWILGIPIFREYMVRFDRAVGNIGFARHNKDVCDNTPSHSFAVTSQKRTRKAQLRTLPLLKDLKFPKAISEFRMLPASKAQTKREYEWLSDP